MTASSQVQIGLFKRGNGKLDSWVHIHLHCRFVILRNSTQLGGCSSCYKYNAVPWLEWLDAWWVDQLNCFWIRRVNNNQGRFYKCVKISSVRPDADCKMLAGDVGGFSWCFHLGLSSRPTTYGAVNLCLHSIHHVNYTSPAVGYNINDLTLKSAWSTMPK